jgi:predicted component of type VI protein secretion system
MNKRLSVVLLSVLLAMSAGCSNKKAQEMARNRRRPEPARTIPCRVRAASRLSAVEANEAADAVKKPACRFPGKGYDSAKLTRP